MVVPLNMKTLQTKPESQSRRTSINVCGATASLWVNALRLRGVDRNPQGGGSASNQGAVSQLGMNTSEANAREQRPRHERGDVGSNPTGTTI